MILKNVSPVMIGSAFGSLTNAYGREQSSNLVDGRRIEHENAKDDEPLQRVDDVEDQRRLPDFVFAVNVLEGPRDDFGGPSDTHGEEEFDDGLVAIVVLLANHRIRPPIRPNAAA